MSFLFVAASLLASPAHAAEKQKLAVLDIEPKGVDKATAETVTDLIAVALKKLGVFDVISRADIQQMLSFEESKQLVGCTSSSGCVAELGGALGVAKVVSGSIGKLGSAYVLNLALSDTKSAKVIERESRDAMSEEALVQAAEHGSRFLVRSLLEGRQGELLLRVSEAGADIEVDGKLVGVSPAPRMKMASGPHTVRVSKRGFISFARDVTIDHREPLVQDATLIPSAEFIDDYDRVANAMRISAWTATGLGVAALATGVVLRLAYNDPRFAAWQRRFDAFAAPGAPVPSAAESNELNTLAASIEQTDTLSLALAVSGGLVAAVGVVLFFVGPRPGIYDQYKTVTVGEVAVSFDAAPLSGGGYAGGTLRF